MIICTLKDKKEREMVTTGTRVVANKPPRVLSDVDLRIATQLGSDLEELLAKLAAKYSSDCLAVMGASPLGVAQISQLIAHIQQTGEQAVEWVLNNPGGARV